MSLAALNSYVKDDAIVEKLEFADATVNRLKSLGVFEGQRITVARRGNPLIIKAAGSRIAIAAGLAQHIWVREFDE